MFLRNLLHSSRFEIITSKRISSLMYSIFGIAIFIWWISLNHQFISAYINLHEFDVITGAFIAITLILFMPLVMVGAFLFAVLLQRLRLRLWFKQIVNYPLYESMLRPAEAGTLVDYEFSNEEIYATLIDLHFRKALLISVDKDSFVATLLTVEGLNAYERTLIDSLFSENNGQFYFSSLQNKRLISAGQEAHQVLIKQLDASGLTPKSFLPNEVLTKLSKIIFYFGGSVGLICAYLYLFQNEKVSAINYPRYPVSVAELIVIGSVSLLAIAVVISGFWPRFSFDHKNKPSDVWLQAEGFRQYLDTVYKDRMNLRNIRTQDSQTIQAVFAYIIAFKIVTLTPSLLNELASLSNQNQHN